MRGAAGGGARNGLGRGRLAFWRTAPMGAGPARAARFHLTAQPPHKNGASESHAVLGPVTDRSAIFRAGHFLWSVNRKHRCRPRRPAGPPQPPRAGRLSVFEVPRAREGPPVRACSESAQCVRPMRPLCVPTRSRRAPDPKKRPGVLLDAGPAARGGNGTTGRGPRFRRRCGRPWPSRPFPRRSRWP